ncbi:MAG: hypothetical protein R3B54_01455 [Bdellovibrionota bacterium]
MIKISTIALPTLAAFFGCIAGSVVLLLAIHLLYPKKIRKDVFTNKYFNEFELGFMRGIPYGLILTAIISGATVFRKIGAGKRFYDYDVRAQMPAYLVVLCHLSIALAIVGLGVMVPATFAYFFPNSGIFVWD